jgi:hypothetical protein
MPHTLSGPAKACGDRQDERFDRICWLGRRVAPKPRRWENAMSWMPAQEPILGDKRTCDALDLIIVPRVRDLGSGFSVHRALPQVKVTALPARLTGDNASGHCHVATAFGLMAFTRKPRRRVFPWIVSLSLFISIGHLEK